MDPVGVLGFCCGLGIAFLMILVTVLLEAERKIENLELQIAFIKQDARRTVSQMKTKFVVQQALYESTLRRPKRFPNTAKQWRLYSAKGI